MEGSMSEQDMTILDSITDPNLSDDAMWSSIDTYCRDSSSVSDTPTLRSGLPADLYQGGDMFGFSLQHEDLSPTQTTGFTIPGHDVNNHGRRGAQCLPPRPTAYKPSCVPRVPATRLPLPLGHSTNLSVFVNANQYYGILRRRRHRAKYEDQHPKPRNAYRHESRCQHAKNRARGSGGRFLTKKETEAAKNASVNNQSSGQPSTSNYTYHAPEFRF